MLLRRVYSLLDKRLFIPEKWFTEEYKDRRKKCKLPEEIEFKTKPQLAVEMLEILKDEEILPFKYIVSDSLYGNSPEFITAIEECQGKIYFVSHSIRYTLLVEKADHENQNNTSIKGKRERKLYLKTQKTNPFQLPLLPGI